MQSFRPSLAVSAVFHAIILLWGLISFTPKSLDAVRTETMSIDLVPISEFTMNKAGSSKAPAKPEKMAESKGDPKELTDLVQKVTEKQEIKATTPPPPAQDQKPPEAKGGKFPSPTGSTISYTQNVRRRGCSLLTRASQFAKLRPHGRPPSAARGSGISVFTTCATRSIAG